jgi:hypothetical protein
VEVIGPQSRSGRARGRIWVAIAVLGLVGGAAAKLLSSSSQLPAPKGAERASDKAALAGAAPPATVPEGTASLEPRPRAPSSATKSAHAARERAAKPSLASRSVPATPPSAESKAPPTRSLQLDRQDPWK